MRSRAERGLIVSRFIWLVPEVSLDALRRQFRWQASRRSRWCPWWRDVTRYQWFVFAVASMGWLFDTMDQQLFNLARKPAVTQLLHALPGDPATAGKVDEYSGFATSIFMIGWALGGIFFGILGDKLGRARTMLMTVLCYSAFTGLSAFSKGVWDFAGYRFLTGLGVGGQFAVGVALVAEVMSDRARPFALGWLQALSSIGNMVAACVGIGLGMLEESGVIASAWRAMFLIGLAPALLAIPIFLRLKEPERWKAAVKEEEQELASDPRHAHKLGSIAELFGDPRWRRNTIVGMVLAFAGVVGLWGIGFFSFDLIRTIFRKHFEAAGPGLPDDRRQADLLGRHHIAGAERRIVLWNPGVLGGDPPDRPQAGLCHFLRPGCTFHGVHILLSHRILADLCVHPDHGFLPACPLRRIRDLLPRALSDPTAEHGHLVLLQRRPPDRGRRPRRCWAS